MSNTVRPHRRQPNRLRRPWDSPGKNTGVGCHFLLQCMKVKSEGEVAQSCPTPATPWTAAYQAPPPMGFSRQEYFVLRGPQIGTITKCGGKVKRYYHLTTNRMRGRAELMSSDIFWSHFRVLPRNNPLSLIMGARITHRACEINSTWKLQHGFLPCSLITRGLGIC